MSYELLEPSGPMVDTRTLDAKRFWRIARMFEKEANDAADWLGDHAQEKLDALMEIQERLPLLVLETQLRTCQECQGTQVVYSGHWHSSHPDAAQECPECAKTQLEIERVQDDLANLKAQKEAANV